MNRRVALMVLAAAGSPTVAAEPEHPPNDTHLEVMTIIGSAEAARRLPGSGTVVDAEQVRIEAATDINQLLKTVPGTYIREEEGFGLRPNIGVRAAGSERSSKVTLLEDGVMIAPAPYSNPAAYYFPTTLRMRSVEILKGAPLLRYGPQTTGGVINLVTAPIPDTASGTLLAMLGEYDSHDVYARYGDRQGGFGWLLETAQRDSDGFKDIDRSSRDAGFDIEDYVLKLGWEDDRQSLLFKAQYSEEASNATYVGLTDTDFDRDASRRYGLSEIDRMDNRHEGYSLTYNRTLDERISASITGYYNAFSRDWFKLDGGGDLIAAANAGDTMAQAVLDGPADTAGLEYKHNDRSYESKGVELNVTAYLGSHELALGGRLHEDEMDRFQPVDRYDQIDGDLVFRGREAPTGSDNRLESADALSLWALDTWQVTDALRVNLALRYEDVETARRQFADPARTQLDSTRSNQTDEWLPGASFTYDVGGAWQVLGGVHRGFSPLGGGAQSFEEPETSVNYEVGVRFDGERLFFETLGFYSDFDNKTENCSLANPCSNGANSGSFTTGEAEVSGVELQASTAFERGRFRIPVALAYTYTQAELSADNAGNGFLDGDTLADIPENTFSLRLGLESSGAWNNHAVIKYLDEMCVTVGCDRLGGRFDETESLLVVDLISRYRFTPGIEVFLKLENLFDEQAIVSRTPDGARPNKPRTGAIGIRVDW